MWLIRHGAIEATRADGTRACIGWTDLALSEPTVTSAQMSALAERLVGAREVISSDLVRASQTAQMLADVLGVPVRREPRLRELHFGDWEGRTWPEVEAQDPTGYWAFMEAWETCPTPGGESYHALQARVASWFEQANGDEIVVAHHGSLRALAGLCGVSDAMAWTWAYGQGREIEALTGAPI